MPAMYTYDRKEHEKRMAWFQEARFGLFIHWGLYSISGKGEWERSDGRLPAQPYEGRIADFTASRYEPREWARLARRAGMRYAVLTTKHHDGFCLFDSALTDFKATESPAGRDLVAEYVTAFREEGLKVGLYYSLLDWHHPDYPHSTDMLHPMRGNPDYPDEGRDFNRYLDYMHGQIRELMTNYGRIDMLFLDYSYGDMKGEKWKAGELVDMVRTLQPGIVINNRLEAGGATFGSLLTRNPLPWHGDYVTPEQIIPPKGIRNEDGELVPWESCVTMNGHWGYCTLDRNWKSSRTLVRKLVECVSKGGNMILNVGPDAYGAFPQESIDILEDFARWMDKNGESIHGCGPYEAPKPEYGRFTKNGDRLFFHAFEKALGAMPIEGVPRDRVLSARSLATGGELPIVDNFSYGAFPDTIFVDTGSTAQLPDETDYVIELRLKEEGRSR